MTMTTFTNPLFEFEEMDLSFDTPPNFHKSFDMAFPFDGQFGNSNEDFGPPPDLSSDPFEGYSPPEFDLNFTNEIGHDDPALFGAISADNLDCSLLFENQIKEQTPTPFPNEIEKISGLLEDSTDGVFDFLCVDFEPSDVEEVTCTEQDYSEFQSYVQNCIDDLTSDEKPITVSSGIAHKSEITPVKKITRRKRRGKSSKTSNRPKTREIFRDLKAKTKKKGRKRRRSVRAQPLRKKNRKKSIYKGVHWEARDSRWRARIYDSNRRKMISGGYHSTEKLAAIAVNKLCRLLGMIIKNPELGHLELSPKILQKLESKLIASRKRSAKIRRTSLGVRRKRRRVDDQFYEFDEPQKLSYSLDDEDYVP